MTFTIHIIYGVYYSVCPSSLTIQLHSIYNGIKCTRVFGTANIIIVYESFTTMDRAISTYLNSKAASRTISEACFVTPDDLTTETSKACGCPAGNTCPMGVSVPTIRNHYQGSS